MFVRVRIDLTSLRGSFVVVNHSVIRHVVSVNCINNSSAVGKFKKFFLIVLLAVATSWFGCKHKSLLSC